jgi:hypothetical protein
VTVCPGELEDLHPVMEKVYRMTWRHEILKEKVPVEEKYFRYMGGIRT